VGVTTAPDCLDAILAKKVDSLDMVSLFSTVAVDVGYETCESKRILHTAGGGTKKPQHQQIRIRQRHLFVSHQQVLDAML
jgi:hypothetical protein